MDNGALLKLSIHSFLFPRICYWWKYCLQRWAVKQRDADFWVRETKLKPWQKSLLCAFQKIVFVVVRIIVSKLGNCTELHIYAREPKHKPPPIFFDKTFCRQRMSSINLSFEAVFVFVFVPQCIVWALSLRKLPVFFVFVFFFVFFCERLHTIQKTCICSFHSVHNNCCLTRLLWQAAKTGETNFIFQCSRIHKRPCRRVIYEKAEN